MSNRFCPVQSPFTDLWLLKRQPIGDNRGFFERLFCADELRAYGHPGTIAQVNRSLTKQLGAVRGMHFQYPPHCEWKLIACTIGKVHDVIVDLRCGSPTFLQKFAIELSGDNSLSLLVPPGCAHGFQTLDENCEMLYFHSHPFISSAEGGIRVDDPRLVITWPLSFTERSVRDANHPILPANYTGVSL